MGHGAIDGDGIGAGRGIHVVPIGSGGIGVGTAISPVRGGVHRALHWKRHCLAGAGGHHFNGHRTIRGREDTGGGRSEIRIIFIGRGRGCATIGAAQHRGT